VTGRHFGGWGRSGFSKECLKTTPGSGCEILRGCFSDEDTHTQSHLVPVLSTTPIDMMEVLCDEHGVLLLGYVVWSC
jgi:hypothetical protein